MIDLVDDDFFAGDGSSLALDDADRPHISYADWASINQYDLRYAYGSSGQWWIEIVDTVPSGQRFAQTSLALDAANRAHIGYWLVGNPDVLKYATRGSAATAHADFLPILVR